MHPVNAVVTALILAAALLVVPATRARAQDVAPPASAFVLTPSTRVHHESRASVATSLALGALFLTAASCALPYGVSAGIVRDEPRWTALGVGTSLGLGLVGTGLTIFGVRKLVRLRRAEAQRVAAFQDAGFDVARGRAQLSVRFAF